MSVKKNQNSQNSQTNPESSNNPVNGSNHTSHNSHKNMSSINDTENKQKNTVENIRGNLTKQVDALFRHSNEKSIKTRYRYRAAVERFCGFLAKEYRLQKLSNVKGKHLKSYIEGLKEDGVSPSTIKTDVSAIRFFHRLSGSKNRLPDNKVMDIPKRQTGKLDRAWTRNEVQGAVQLALGMGREDIAYGIRMAETFGMRLEELTRCQCNHLKEALPTGELYIKGKGGQVRYLPLTSGRQKKLAKELIEYAARDNRKGTDRVLFDNVRGSTAKAKKSYQNWIANHRIAFEEKNREAAEAFRKKAEEVKKQGLKIKVDKITAHGLRHKYAQDRYDLYLKKGFSDKRARMAVSEELGHHRLAITKIYLNAGSMDKPDKEDK